MVVGLSFSFFSFLKKKRKKERKKEGLRYSRSFQETDKRFFKKKTVIPAPRAYVEVVEIKTLVVRMLSYLANTGRKNFLIFRLPLKLARFFGYKNLQFLP